MKAAAILLCPVVPLRQLPPGEVEVVRRFLFQHIRGMDPENDKRWKRLWGDLWHAPAGEGFQLYRAEERGGPFHRRHRVILQRLFEAQERYTNVDAMHEWLKLKAFFVTWGEGKNGQPKLVSRSTAFDVCSEDEMRELHNKIVDLLHESGIQRHLFPKVKAKDRQGMVDAVLANPEENT
jgi:hypothetical protein